MNIRAKKTGFLWLDDIRLPPESDMLWARTIEEAKLIIDTVEVVECSLDHDLGLHEYDPHEEDADLRRVPARFNCYDCDALTWEKGLNMAPDCCVGCGGTALSKMEVPDGVEFAKWLVAQNKVPPVVKLHSMNPVGAQRMADVLSGHCELTILPYQRY